MRRRLTVTGASSNIDGVVGRGQEVPEPKKSKKKKVSTICFHLEFEVPIERLPHTKPDFTCFSIKPLSDALLQNILGFQRKVTLLTTLERRIKML